MSISDQLFEGSLIRLAPPDPDRDAAIESQWTHDPEYLHLMDSDPARPQSPGQIRKKYEAAEKDGDKQFLFAIRTRAEDRLVGFVKVADIVWNHGNCRLTIGLGEAADRSQGYGSEALGLMLRFIFGEMNSHRISVVVPGDNDSAIRFFEKHRFVVEVRQRQAIARNGQRWDIVWLGLLQQEWSGAR